MSPAAVDIDPYLVLGVPRSATAAEIRAAYHALGARYHPDRHQGNPLEELASAKMAEINRAYEILSDPARRAAFDRGGSPGGGGGWAAGATAPRGGATGGYAPAGRPSRRLIRIVAILSLLPFIARFGGLLVRGVAALVRELAEGLTVIRGTPFAAGGALLAAVILIVALLRRRGSRRKAG